MKINRKHSIRLFSTACLTLLGLAAASPAHAQGIKAYLSGPGVSNESYSGAQIETFNSFSAANFTTLSSSTLALNGQNATYTESGTTSPVPSVKANDVYAANATSGNYLAVTPGNSVTLTLAVAVPYVGIDIPALDGGNSVSFYSATGALLGTFNAGTVTSFFASTTVIAVNGQAYQSSSYKAQPGNTSTNTNSGEYYAYVHFFGQDGTTIKSIKFSQANGGNFETENHSILTTQPAVDGTFVYVPGAVAVPEPGAGVVAALGCAGLLALGRWRRRAR